MDKEESQNNSLFLFGMIMSMFCWGLSWTSGKILSFYSGPLSIGFYRFAVTFISLFFIIIFLKEKKTINRAGIFDLLCASGLIALYTYLFFKGLTLGKAGAGGVLVTILNPIISFAFMLAFTKRLPNKNETIGLLLGLTAGVILLQLWSSTSTIFSSGNIYFLLAALTWSLLSMFTAKAGRYGSSVTFSFWMYGIGSIVMLLVSDWNENLKILSIPAFSFWGNLFFSATITTSLATTFYFLATSKLGASKASSFIFMVPFTAAMGSWFFLREQPSLHTVIGGLLGIGAVYIINKKAKHIGN